MIRELTAASAALIALGACPFAPQASAADSDQIVRIQDGKMRCLLSADYEGRGRAMAVCGLSDGAPFGSSPMTTGKYPQPLNLVFAQGTGETYWNLGTLPASEASDVVLGAGQTYSVNGWTITEGENQAVIRNDLVGHGIIVDPVRWRGF